jgi:hypothetical protein
VVAKLRYFLGRIGVIEKRQREGHDRDSAIMAVVVLGESMP